MSLAGFSKGQHRLAHCGVTPQLMGRAVRRRGQGSGWLAPSLLGVLVAGVSAAAAGAVADQQVNDWLIVPGERVGPITANVTEADLVTLFGRDAVTQEEVRYFEGRFRPATVIFAVDSTRRIEVLWTDDSGRARPERIQLRGSASRWRTSDGITLGTSAAELERLNGRPFRITSSCCDYSGAAWSWEGGALEERLVRTELRLQPAPDAFEQHPLSTDVTVREAGSRVLMITMYFL